MQKRVGMVDCERLSRDEHRAMSTDTSELGVGLGDAICGLGGVAVIACDYERTRRALCVRADAMEAAALQLCAADFGCSALLLYLEVLG